MSAAYTFEFAYTLLGDGIERIERVENIHWVGRRARKGIVTTYLVQIINKPYQVLSLHVSYTFFIRLLVEYLVEFVAEIG